MRGTSAAQLLRPITPDEILAYKNAGVVLLRGVLDQQTVNRLRRQIDEAVATLHMSPSGYDFTRLTSAYEAADQSIIDDNSHGQHNVRAVVEHMRASGKPLLFDDFKRSGEGHFYIDTGATARIMALREFAIRGPVTHIAGSLLGGEHVRFFGDQIFVKEPGTRERTAFHQDATYFEIDGEQCCVIWVPVDPVTPETGGMTYWRGSHLDGSLYKPNVFVSQTTLPGAEGVDLPDIEGNPDDFDLVSFDVEPGDVLVHHFRTVHGASGNASRYQVRRAISIRYCGDDIRVRRRPWAPKQPQHTDQLIEGEPLSGPSFPTVWKRAKRQEAA